jgi:hypothetical protein
MDPNITEVNATAVGYVNILFGTNSVGLGGLINSLSVVNP